MSERQREETGISDNMAEARNTGTGGAGAAVAEPQRSSLYFVWQGIRSDPMAMLGAVMLGGFVLSALFAPWLSPYGPNEADPFLRLRGPGTEGHPLGLDNQGRDMLTRLVFGTRMSLITGFGPVLIGALIAIPLGTIAAFYGRAGQIIMRVMDVFFAFPMVLLAILIAAFLGPGLVNLMISLTVVLIPYNARIVYIEALAQKSQGYVEAAYAAATSEMKILFVEILPHIVSASVVYSMTIVGPIVILAAGLSFLGLGVQQPTAEWGMMTASGRLVLHKAPHASILPGVAIFLFVTAVNLLGDSLRDSLDPRTRLQRIRHRN